jgi:hypothetical protein
MSLLGQSRRFGRPAMTSGLTPETDMVRLPRDVSNVPFSTKGSRANCANPNHYYLRGSAINSFM